MAKDSKPKYDMNSAEAKVTIDDIVHGTFMRQGTMVAFPTCFPGASVPIPADESRITALDVTPDGIVYGGTSGRAAHLFVGMFHGVTGIVFDRGVVENADSCVAVGCAKSRFVACVNGPGGGRVLAGKLQDLPFDLIQEWGFWRTSYDELGSLGGERIEHAVADTERNTLVGITPTRLFTVGLNEGKPEVAGEVSGRGRIAVGSGQVFGQDGPAHLWRFDLASRKIDRCVVPLPAGDWQGVSRVWARDSHDGLLYTADDAGTLYAFGERTGFSDPLGRVPVAPVSCMAVTHDGRLFGFCGPDLARMFCYNPRSRAITDLGVAVSVLERRRYGYTFGDAVTGRDGQIYFGEDDDLGHLWIYFPSIPARGAADA